MHSSWIKETTNLYTWGPVWKACSFSSWRKKQVNAFLVNTLILVGTAIWGIPQIIVTTVFIEADSSFRISPDCRIDSFFPGVTHNAGFSKFPKLQDDSMFNFPWLPHDVAFFQYDPFPRLFPIREIPHDVEFLQSKSKRDQLKQGKRRGSQIQPISQ